MRVSHKMISINTVVENKCISYKYKKVFHFKYYTNYKYFSTYLK